ncbi:ribosome-associated heat shock protein Hsp15 [Providencia sp. PROV188]|jgi:ribosome-associated heat shock protein Hsp15|uniref:ribosome-associated heat shock protein Hsp15 n=1 Tax=Providencia TaxID=586 RepID=UPI0003E1D598|nr:MULTISPECIES: ribosome-associated heat shock protein Hsp15 [Providencia]ETT01748.1 heat shock protein 15 [Providencia alcalifaciens PAL-3]EUD00470.1 heat shock protein 15 [Providencia alcalifaciens PAL-1]MBC5788830.1 ribosome-associated heat shock protein Hsp15 [Providencia sp. JUb39]MBG5884722.1 ribosome-associated heat shock protein Hsp15 [Providencia alcalifaciens]MDR2242855.1 ribosome-associated heat shock protein Hsp15 [Providencia alcalifaciens]
MKPLSTNQSSTKPSSAEQVRLDKWLWVARFYKTRSIAREMIDGGKVHYNGQRSKPGKIVELGAMIKVRQGNDERIIEVLEISNQRKGAPEAQLLYRETVESLEQREKMAMARKMNALTMPHPDRRPDKKERRTLLKFKHTNSHESS